MYIRRFNEGFQEDYSSGKYEDQLKGMRESLQPLKSMVEVSKIFMNERELVSIIERVKSALMTGIKNEAETAPELKEHSTIIISRFNEGFEKYKDELVDDFSDAMDKILIYFFRAIDQYKNDKDTEKNLNPNGDKSGDEELTNKEIRNLIDQALDIRDYDEVKRLSSLIKESIEIKEDIIQHISKTLINLAISLI